MSINRGSLVQIKSFKNPALRLFAWFCIVALMIASWTPSHEMIRTGFNTRLEHVVAYLVATIVVCLAYPRVHPLRVIGAMMGYALCLELGQMLVPGRHASVPDWIASSTGAMCGCSSLILARCLSAKLGGAGE
jgi:VanZ family protein